jgi:hypothetical protein
MNTTFILKPRGHPTGRPGYPMLYVYLIVALAFLSVSWLLGRRRRAAFYANPTGDDVAANLPAPTMRGNIPVVEPPEP